MAEAGVDISGQYSTRLTDEQLQSVISEQGDGKAPEQILRPDSGAIPVPVNPHRLTAEDIAKAASPETAGTPDPGILPDRTAGCKPIR
jgi:hypothetical protein